MTSAHAHGKPARYVLEATPGDYTVLLKAYRVTAHAHNTPLFDAPHGFTSSLGEADVYLHGTVNADGTSSWHFDAQDRGLLHLTEDSASDLGRLMRRMYSIARKLMGDDYYGPLK